MFVDGKAVKVAGTNAFLSANMGTLLAIKSGLSKIFVGGSDPGTENLLPAMSCPVLVSRIPLTSGPTRYPCASRLVLVSLVQRIVLRSTLVLMVRMCYDAYSVDRSRLPHLFGVHG
eukprot:302747-Rhodomonas_salina.2